MFAAEQWVAAGQAQILGQATIHPGERIVSVTTYNPPIPVQARTLQPALPPVTPATVPVIINYVRLDFDNLQPVEAASTTVTNLGAEDVLVLQAWSNVVSGLMVASQEADLCAKSLGSADVLNGATIVRQGSVSVSQQFVNRRQVANAYGTAVQQWESRVTGLGGQYLVQLYQAKVSSDRARLEQNRLNTAIEDRVKRQLKICAMERDIALGYNRAVSTLETYQAYASPAQAPATVGNGGIPGRPVRVASPDTPNSPANQYAKQLAEQTANLQDLQRSLYQFRQHK